jgi:hypothetical protein
MKNLEQLLKQQSEHLDHLQGRLDVLQASVSVLIGFVASLVAVVPPEQYKNEAFGKRLKAYMATYEKAVKRGDAQLSEFPFVPNPPREEPGR